MVNEFSLDVMRQVVANAVADNNDFDGWSLNASWEEQQEEINAHDTQVVWDAIWPGIRELLATIKEYEHALEHVAEGHSKLPPPYNTPDCKDCMALAQSALDGVNRADFRQQVDDGR